MGITVFFFFLMFFKNHFWERETERQRQSLSGGGAEREGDTGSKAGSRLWAASIEPDVELEPTNHGIMPWAEVRRLTNWATQAPQTVVVLSPQTCGNLLQQPQKANETSLQIKWGQGSRGQFSHRQSHRYLTTLVYSFPWHVFIEELQCSRHRRQSMNKTDGVPTDTGLEGGSR